MQSLSVDGQHGLWSERKTFDYANFSDSYGFFTSFDFWNTPSSTKTSFQIDVALTLYVAECRWHPWDTGDKQLSFWILQWYTDSFPASKAWTAMFWSTCPGKDRWHRQICSVSSFPKFDYFVAALKKHTGRLSQATCENTPDLVTSRNWNLQVQREKSGEDFEDGNVESVECRKSSETDGTSSLDADLDWRKMLRCGFWWRLELDKEQVAALVATSSSVEIPC